MRNIIEISKGVLCVLAAAILFSGFNPVSVQAQEEDDQLYLLFEFMKVKDQHLTAYLEAEDFWSGIHEERVERGEITGWDLWSLLPGGSSQGSQYLTVTVFADEAGLFGSGQSSIMELAQSAYPEMSEEELTERLSQTTALRDRTVRYFLAPVGGAQSDFEMQEGMVAGIDLMKVEQGNFQTYENAELEIFRPWHQEQIDAGNKGYWELRRIMSPTGSDTYATHITINMYEDWDQYLSSGGNFNPTFSEQMMVERGLETRDLKWTYLATLVQMVR